jgi:DNA-binding transcriptional regulator WhiA
MEKHTNIGINRNILENLSTENTVPFEVDAPKKFNYHESDVYLIDLAELCDMNPVNISDYEKQMTAIFLEKLLVDLDTKVIIDITTTPHELACFFLTAIRSMPQQFSNEC